jgi:hypothetical protein
MVKGYSMVNRLPCVKKTRSATRDTRSKLMCHECEAAASTGRSHGRAMDQFFSFFILPRAACARSHFLHRVGSARRADQREDAAQTLVADLG